MIETRMRAVPSSTFGRFLVFCWKAALALVVFVYLPYKLVYPDYSYRYRLALTVVVDGQAHTGSSVIDVKWIGGPRISDRGAYGAHARVRGQAVFVDLGERGALVASIGGGGAPDALGAQFLCSYAFGNDSSDDKLPLLAAMKGRRDLRPGGWPGLIWFSNPRDPATARRVQHDHLPAELEPTARITEAFVEITDAPIVIDIPAKLPWFQAWVDNYRQRGPIWTDNELSTLYPTMFVGGAV